MNKLKMATAAPKAAPVKELDYTPKRYRLKEDLVFGAKVLMIIGAIVLLLWLVDKNL